MKVLYVGSDAQVCGASFSMVKLIDELDSIGIDVVPVVHKGNTNNLLNEKKRKHYVVNAWSWALGIGYSSFRRNIIMICKKILNIPCYFQYRKIINIEKPDIVHINALTTYSAAKAAIDSGVPVVWHIREMLEEDLNSSFWNVKEAHTLMKKATYFIAISQCVENKYQKIVGADKIRCIYNGIDIDLFYAPEHSIMRQKSIVITMAGRITKFKGQLDCLQELIPILKINPNVILQFAGIGSDDDIQNLIACRDNAELNQNQVKLLGFVKDMNHLWEKTDIAIVYSKFEAFGRVTIEAKMAGALVVGYNSGGTTELIDDGVNGFLFGNGYESLSGVVQKILLNQQEAIAIARNGQQQAVTIFTSENNAKQIVSLYQEILRK